MRDGKREDPGRRMRRAHREVLLGALDGIDLSEAELQLVGWLAFWDDWTVTTTAMIAKVILNSIRSSDGCGSR